MKNKTAKILLVEDDTNLGIVLSDFLEMCNYEVVLATDGIVGMEFFKNGDFDLCILDVMLPFKDGFTIAEEIRIKNQEIPIIFLTAKIWRKTGSEGSKPAPTIT